LAGCRCFLRRQPKKIDMEVLNYQQSGCFGQNFHERSPLNADKNAFFGENSEF